MNANFHNTRLVLVQYIHKDCHLYCPRAPRCDQVRAELLPWITERNIKAGTATIAQRAQQQLRERIQELVVARARTSHTNYPVVRDRWDKNTKMCCRLRGIYPQWEGHTKWGDNICDPDLLAEEPMAFANQLVLMSRRGFIDSLVVEFEFGVDAAPMVQSAQEYMFSPGPLHQRARILPPSLIDAVDADADADAVTTTTATTSKPPNEEQGESTVDSTTSSQIPRRRCWADLGLMEEHEGNTGILSEVPNDDKGLAIDDSDHPFMRGSDDT